jgi:hypothetical protein
MDVALAYVDIIAALWVLLVFVTGRVQMISGTSLQNDLSHQVLSLRFGS